MFRKLGFFVLSMAAMTLVGAGFSTAMGGRVPADDTQEHGNVNGTDRTYFLHIPKSLAENAPAPLVLVFHGGGSHAATMPNFTHFGGLAHKEGFLVAHPESFNKPASRTEGSSPSGWPATGLTNWPLWLRLQPPCRKRWCRCASPRVRFP